MSGITHLILCPPLTTQEKGGELWGFSGNVIVYCGDTAIGSCDALATWVADSWGFEDYRPMAFYEALARDAYNAHITRQEVGFFNFNFIFKN